MYTNQVLYQYIADKKAITLQQAQAQYSNLCYYKVININYQKYLDFVESQKEKLSLLRTSNEINNDINKTNQDLLIYSQQLRSLNEFTVNINEYIARYKQDKQIGVITIRDTLVNETNIINNIIKTYNNNIENLKIELSIVEQTTSSINNAQLVNLDPNNYTNILIWNTDNITKPTDEELFIANEKLNIILTKQEFSIVLENKIKYIINHYESNKYSCSFNNIKIIENIQKVVQIIENTLQYPINNNYYIAIANTLQIFKIPVNSDNTSLLQEYLLYLKSFITNEATVQYNYNNYIVPLQNLSNMTTIKEINDFVYILKPLELTTFFTNKQINLEQYIVI